MRWLDGLKVGLVLLLWGAPADADRVKDEDSFVSFVPPPYFQTRRSTQAPVRFILAAPDKKTTIITGTLVDRKINPIGFLSAAQVTTLCERAKTLVPAGMTLVAGKRVIVDEKKGADCSFQNKTGKTIRWVGIPQTGQLLFFYSDWQLPPNTEQIDIFRFFVGSIQIF